MAALPEYYFRLRENGAFVFRVESSARNGRLELDQIATVNIRNGEVKPQGDRVLTEADRAAIAAWVEERRNELARREAAEVRRTIEAMNLTTQWLQSRAGAAEVEAVTDDLLLAMHDLRSVLIRKRAEGLARAEDD